MIDAVDAPVVRVEDPGSITRAVVVIGMRSTWTTRGGASGRSRQAMTTTRQRTRRPRGGTRTSETAAAALATSRRISRL
jgi:hypothetical protein